MDQMHYKSATELASLIRRKKVSALELLDHFLARVDKYNPKLNAIIWMDRDKARKRAKAADAALKKGKRLGPLHGVPMTIKESYQVAGSPTTWGLPATPMDRPRMSAFAQPGHADPAAQCPLSGEERKASARSEYFRL